MSEERAGADRATSVDVVFDEVQRHIDAQNDLFASLNTRISFVLTTATVLITFGFGGLAGIVDLWSSEPVEVPTETPPPSGGSSPPRYSSTERTNHR